MLFDIETEVYINGFGKANHKHTQEFADDSNVFGRVLEYHQYMEKVFPGCEYKLIKAKERTE